MATNLRRPTRYEAYLNYLTVFLLGGLLLLTLYGVFALPDRIPTHFNLSGEPDGWGSPSMLFITTGLGLLMEWGIWASRKLPIEFMNFPGPRTPENIARQMHNIGQMMAVLRVIIALIFLSLTGSIIWMASGSRSRLPVWIIFAFVALLTVSTVIFAVRAYRLAEHS